MAAKGITFTESLGTYLTDHSVPQVPAQRELIAATLDQVPDWSIMQISPEQGSFMTWITRLLAPGLAVEVGTFTGYSALSIALGLPEGGRLVCCDVSEEWTAIARRHWELAGVADRIDLRIAPAEDTLLALPADPPVDLAFIDADKVSYPRYYELLLERLRPGGVILVDNVLYFGTVLDDAATDPNTVAIRSFNQLVRDDERVDAAMVNVGDGLTLIRKR